MTQPDEALHGGKIPTVDEALVIAAHESHGRPGHYGATLAGEIIRLRCVVLNMTNYAEQMQQVAEAFGMPFAPGLQVIEKAKELAQIPTPPASRLASK